MKKTDRNYITFPLACIVHGCNNLKQDCPHKNFFSLPHRKEWRQKWLMVCKREDLFSNMDPNLGVCSDHFMAEQFTSSSKKSLKEDSIPTLFPLRLEHYDEDTVLNAKDVYLQPGSTESDTTIIKSEPDIDCYLDDYSDSENGESLNHPGQLCRLCANNTGDLIYIFSSAGIELNIANKINSSLPILVKKTDPLPKQLCSSCVLKLDMCYEFSQSCIKAEEKLKTLLKIKQFWSCPSRDIYFNKKTNMTTLFKMEANSFKNNESLNLSLEDNSLSETLSNNSRVVDIHELNKDSYSCPLCCEGRVSAHTRDTSVPSVDTDDENSCNKDQSVEMNDNTSEKIREKINVDTNHLQSNVMYEVSDVDGNNYTLVEGSVGWWNDENSLQNAEIIIETLNSEGTNVLHSIDDREANNWIAEDQMEVENQNPTCQLCGKLFSSEEFCLGHSKVHADIDYYPCSLCGSCFMTERDIMSHIEEHKSEANKQRTKITRGRIICRVCGRRFNNERTLSEHTCGQSETKQFRCETCKKAYITEERLAFHRKFHEGARPNYCGQCGKEFDNEGTLYYHTRMVHEGARPFCCDECGKRFYSNARLEAHKRVHTGERPYECEVCGRRFYDRETLKGHYITHMSIKPFQCDLCGVCCGRKSMLKQHIRTHHNMTYMPKRIPSLIHYYCKTCNETFTSSSDVLTHRTTHWGTMENAGNENKDPKPHICEYCGKSFSVITSLGKHRKQEHPNEHPYVCSICKETSRTLYEARTHRKIHTSAEDLEAKERINTDSDKVQKMFICEECGKSLPGRRKFLAHLKSHRVDLPFSCSICGKKFNEKQRLDVHMRLHTGEKPYSCSECGKRFTQSSALYTHSLLHTGEKPHSCDLCGKAFRIKADRDNHRRTHTGEKPYRCEFCGKRFRTGQVYYQHRMIHTDERRFPCDVCGKAFKRSHTLAVHKRIHTGEKPNICDVCGRGFRQRTDMRKHRALHAE